MHIIKMKDCNENQIRNPETRRCVLRTSPLGKQLLKGIGSDSRRASFPRITSSSSRRASPRRDSPKAKKPCKAAQVRNPETGRCVLKTSPKGKQILKGAGSSPRRSSSSPRRASPIRASSSPRRASPIGINIIKGKDSDSKRTSQIKTVNFERYISIVQKQVHHDLRITKNTKNRVNYFLNLLAVKLVEEAVSTLSGKKTLTSRNIHLAVENLFQANLKTHAISEGTRAVTRFTSATKKGTRSAKAGLRFSVSLAENIIRDNCNDRIGAGAPVYLAAVLEYISAELLELSGNFTKDNGKNTIEPTYLKSAVEKDTELNMLAKYINFE